MFKVNINMPPDYVEKKGNLELRIYYRAKFKGGVSLPPYILKTA
ncbi:hypothetical protein [Clostridium muellerianum]|nr:hypothetical protein [Clostridium muellerianum]